MVKIGILDILMFLIGLFFLGIFLVGLAMFIYGIYLGWLEGFPLS